jgi:ATP-dependent helicase/nuclease subunit A
MSILSRFDLTPEQRAAVTGRQPAISVTAGAGSGKTLTLVGRYLSLLEAGLPLHSLVAITFTDKAAREMRNRVRAAATDWLAQSQASDLEMWQEAFSALDSALISTIHALCATILRAHPAEAGLDPAFGVLDEGASAVWRARSVEDGLAWAATQPDVVDLFSVFQEAQLRRLMSGLLSKRLDAAQALSGLTSLPLERWATALDDWCADHLDASQWEEALHRLATLQADKADDKLEVARQAVLADWTAACQAWRAKEWDLLFEKLLALRGDISTGGQKGNWAEQNLAAAREAMASLRAHFDQNLSQVVAKNKPSSWALDRRVAGLLPLVGRLFEQTEAIYQSYKSEAGALDFDDLEDMTARLLTGNQALREHWQSEIGALLLVDEFQDTNQRQRNIVYALSGFVPATAAPGRRAALFVVGDAKQSIYRFRGADVTVFRGVQADIREAGGALIDFDLTFRAHKRLVDLINALLAPLMASQEDPSRPYDVPFAPLRAYRSEPRPHMRPPYVEFVLGLGEDKDAGRWAAAVGLARHMSELQTAGQIEWQDVALLFRASTAFGIYEDALERAGIPFVTVAGRGFYDRPEIRDLLNVLAAIADPSDDLAMAGLLRSPSMGLSDAALYRLRWGGNGERRPFWTTLKHLSGLDGLEEEDRLRAESARRIVATLHDQTGRVPVAHLLKAYLDMTHYRAALRLVAGGERLRRNIDKLLGDAYGSELVSVAEFLEYVAVLRDAGVRESEAPTEAGGAVQLMTIHKAKGLEFPVVILADAGYTPGPRSEPFYLDQELGLLLHLSDGDAQPAAYRLGAWREGEQQAAEERRLLYVAATRAREKLILSGNVKLSMARASTGQLRFTGWLAELAQVVGLSEAYLADVPASPHSVSLDWGDGLATCTIQPPVSVLPPLAFSSAVPPVGGLDERADLLAPLATVTGLRATLDRKLKERESDPPERVWRVVPKDTRAVPALVIGNLTHVALRYWLFPDQPRFSDFLQPFALEAGLTDPTSIRTALGHVESLLARFQSHPLFAQITSAKRYHEVPYSVMVDGQPCNGMLDLLFCPGPDAEWTIVEFKTDHLAGTQDLAAYVGRAGYDRQVQDYVQAIEQQMGHSPKVLLVFLNVGHSIRVLAPGPDFSSWKPWEKQA